MSLMNSKNESEVIMNAESLKKVLDLFLPRMPSVILVCTPEDLEQLKTLEPSLNGLEDLVKCDDPVFVSL